MKKTKQKQLLAAVRACPPLEPPSNFCEQALSAIRRDELVQVRVTLFEQLNQLFPRLAMAALVVIVVGLAFQLYADGDIATQLAEASDEWLLPINWL